MPLTTYEHAGTVIIDGESYEMVRPSGLGLSYKQSSYSRFPWEGGVPPEVVRQIESWHKGGFKTYLPQERLPRQEQGVVVEQSEYGVNSDPRWPNRLMPGPKINTISLDGNTDPVTFIWQQPAQVINGTYQKASVWFVAGNKVYVSDNLVDAVVSYEDATDPPLMGVNWQGVNYIVTTTRKIVARSETVQATSRPDGAGASTQWLPTGGANWQNVDETTQDGLTTFNGSLTTNDLDPFTFSNISISDPVSGVSLVAVIYYNAFSGTLPRFRLVCRIGSTNYYGDTVDIPVGGVSTQLFSWPVSPATGTAWTESEFNGAQFGYQLVTPSSPALGMYVTQLFAQVFSEDWNTVDATADWLTIGPRRMFKVYNDSSNGVTLKNITPGLDPTDESDWGDEVIVPGVALDAYVPLVPFQKTAIVATDRGTHGVDSDGTGIRIVERMQYSPRTLAVQDPYLYISHGHGLTRWFPGLVESCGLEKNLENQSGINGIFDALAFIGKWVFATLSPLDGNTQILVGRDYDRVFNDTDYPLVWDTLIDTGVTVGIKYLLACRWAGLTAADGSFALFFGAGTDLSYCLFPETGGAPEVDDPDYMFVTSAVRYSSRMRFGTKEDKKFHRIVAKGSGLTADIKWSIAYRIEGGSWVTTDRDSVAMSMVSDSVYEFTLPNTAVGEDIQLRLTYSSDDDTTKGEVEYIRVYAVPQSEKGRVDTLTLRLANGIFHTDSTEERSVAEQHTALKALEQSATPVATTGPWGEDVYLTIRAIEVQEVIQPSDNQVEMIVRVEAQEYE